MTALHNPASYMKLRGYRPDIVLECAICPTRFRAQDGLAIPARNRAGEPVMAAVCCAKCYLEAIPVESLWRA